MARELGSKQPGTSADEMVAAVEGVTATLEQTQPAGMRSPLSLAAFVRFVHSAFLLSQETAVRLNRFTGGNMSALIAAANRLSKISAVVMGDRLSKAQELLSGAAPLTIQKYSAVCSSLLKVDVDTSPTDHPTMLTSVWTFLKKFVKLHSANIDDNFNDVAGQFFTAFCNRIEGEFDRLQQPHLEKPETEKILRVVLFYMKLAKIFITQLGTKIKPATIPRLYRCCCRFYGTLHNSNVAPNGKFVASITKTWNGMVTTVVVPRLVLHENFVALLCQPEDGGGAAATDGGGGGAVVAGGIANGGGGGGGGGSCTDGKLAVLAASLPYIASMSSTPPEVVLAAVYGYVSSRYSSLHCRSKIALAPTSPALATPTSPQPAIYTSLLSALHAYCLQLPAAAFPSLEAALFKRIGSPDFYAGVLTIDLWQLLARNMPSELCLRHAETAAALCNGAAGQDWLLHERLVAVIRCTLPAANAAAKDSFYQAFGPHVHILAPAQASNQRVLLWSWLQPTKVVPQQKQRAHAESLRQACAAVLIRCASSDGKREPADAKGGAAAAPAKGASTPSVDLFLSHACHGLRMLWLDGFQDRNDALLIANLCSSPYASATLSLGDVAAASRLVAQILPSFRTTNEYLAVMQPLSAVINAQRQPSMLADVVGELVQAFSWCPEKSVTGDARSMDLLLAIVGTTTAAGTAGPNDWLQWSEMLQCFLVFALGSKLDQSTATEFLEEKIGGKFKATLEGFFLARAPGDGGGSIAESDEQLMRQLQPRVAALACAYTARAKASQKRVIEDKAASATAKRARSECATSTAAAVAAARSEGSSSASAAIAAAAIQHLRNGLQALGKVQRSGGGGGGGGGIPGAAVTELKQVAAAIGNFVAGL